MSQSDDDPGALTQALRTVTPPTGGRENREMDTFGWGMFLGLVILLVPLLPFVILVWLVTKGLDALTGRDEGESA